MLCIDQTPFFSGVPAGVKYFSISWYFGNFTDSFLLIAGRLLKSTRVVSSIINEYFLSVTLILFVKVLLLSKIFRLDKLKLIGQSKEALVHAPCTKHKQKKRQSLNTWDSTFIESEM